MIEPSVIYAVIAGVGVALAAGVLGCFVVWRRMAYFGDSLSHAALAGIPLGIIVGMGAEYGALVVAIVFAFILSRIYGRVRLTTDTVLGIVSHSFLGVGLVAVSLIGLPESDHLELILFGDILTVGSGGIIGIYVCSAVVFLVLAFRWKHLVLMSINPDLAESEGINTFRLNFILMFLMALVVAACFRAVGVLLVASLLIIPPATGRIFARSPEMMAVLSCAVGVASVLAGIYGSLLYDTPSGPSIVTASTVFFVMFFIGSILFERMFKRGKILR
ncbi:metal ABC transporter permease [Candidatus Mycalebacterium sp.]